MKEGKLKIKNSLKGSIYISKREEHKLPKEYVFADRSLNNIICQFELLNGESGHIVKVIVNGQELLKDTAETERKAIRIKEREEREAREREAKENEKKFKALNASFKDDSFDITKTFCPKDTVSLNIQRFEVDNFALKLDKFARFDYKDSKENENKFHFFNGQIITKGSRGDKQTILPKFMIKHNNYGFGKDEEAVEWFTKIKNKELNRTELFLGKSNYGKVTLKPNWRLIIGLGGASVYETSMTLHHIYGFPYIPASSVKGVLRSWILVNYFNGSEDKNAEEKAGKCENFQKIFGTQEEAGKIIFFDTFPTKPPKIEVDVMTPHYGDYYTDNENKKRIAPTDTMSPNPIPFLTVADTPFQFLFGSKDFEINQKLWSFEEGGEAKTLSEWLKSALENHGIGAKTAVGYGYMQ
jgi:CRISPR-associated protein Cmr6